MRVWIERDEFLYFTVEPSDLNRRPHVYGEFVDLPQEVFDRFQSAQEALDTAQDEIHGYYRRAAEQRRGKK